jgi:hypothetical protein
MERRRVWLGGLASGKVRGWQRWAAVGLVWQCTPGQGMKWGPILMEVYIDDVVVKSVRIEDHMTDLKLSLEWMKKYGLRMNPLKCAFGVMLGKLLGFVVHEHSIQI